MASINWSLAQRTTVIKDLRHLKRIGDTLATNMDGLDTFDALVPELPEWVAKFNRLHAEIELHMSSADNSLVEAEQDAIFNEFKDDVAYIKRLARDYIAPPARVEPPKQSQGAHVSARLPKLSLGTFSGDIASWNHFSDLFRTLVHDNETLSPIEKFHYLKLSLQDEPLNLIKNLTVTTVNYKIALDLLQDRYDSTRLIVSHHVEQILNMPTIQNPTFAALTKLINILNENLSALESFKLPVSEWSFLLVVVITNKLDTKTRNRWELKLSRHELPTLQLLKEFLREQASALEWQTRTGLTFSSKVTPLVRNKTLLAKPRSNNQFSRTRNYSDTLASCISSRPSTVVQVGNHQSSASCSKGSRQTAMFVTKIDDLPRCRMCSASHRLTRCYRFLNKSPSERFRFVTKEGVCINCLQDRHTPSQCPSKGSCATCNQHHHSLLHFGHQSPTPQGSTSQPALSKGMAMGTTSDSKVALLTSSEYSRSTVVLSTARAEVQDGAGHWQPVRVLLDSASQSSYMTESCCRRLGLSYKPCNIPIQTLGGVRTPATKGLSHCELRPCLQTSPVLPMTAIIVQRICNPLPTRALPVDVRSSFEDLPLADPTFWKPDQIDILIGADLYLHVLLDGRKVNNLESLGALNTIFGWIIMGETRMHDSDSCHTFHLKVDDPLDSVMRKFWEVEEITALKAPLSVEDARCETMFTSTTTRDVSGRYCVKLPFKTYPPELGDSYRGALQCYVSLQRRLVKNAELYREYAAFMQDYLDNDHMELVCQPELGSRDQYFIPHHCVFKPDSTTTKLRVVFNASKLTTTGVSLNDEMYTGPALQQDISAILLRFRMHAFVLTSDVRQMYRQILICPEHRPYQRILWNFNVNQPAQVFELKTVTYGTNCAPYLALRTLHQLARDEGARFPHAAQALNQDTYVDDVITGADTLAEAIELQRQLSYLCAAGQFELRKWSSNHLDTLASVPSQHRQAPDQLLDLDKASTIKVLGLCWNPSTDCFTYHIQPISRACTKRTILSDIARIFDPLGWLSPLTLLGKRIIQRLWMLELGWDDPPPKDVVDRWEQFQLQLSALSKLQLPRHATTNGATNELIGFCDASEAGYAAALYLRSETANALPNVSLLCAKARVTPLKRISLPRLELCAALLLARLIKFAQDTVPFKLKRLYVFSDSTVALAWIRSSPHRWKTFVCNRVTEIQSIVDPQHWSHVRSADNPADCASRGLLPSDLLHHKLWWSGPEWLINPPDSWPVASSHVDTTATGEEVVSEEAKVTLATMCPPQNELITRYSSFSMLLRITAYCLRFLQRCRSPETFPPQFLTTEELENALIKLIRVTQHSDFADIIASLKLGHTLPKQIQRLSPFLDDHEVLRVGGRLRHADLSSDRKHTMLLPQHSDLTHLIIDFYHQMYLHIGPQALQAVLARKFWILCARNVIRQRLSRCKQCFRANPRSLQPMMGDLPSHRVTALRPFTAVGVDYAGPFFVTPSRGRGIRKQKGYLCLFVCFSTKALHLELVSDLTTEAFICALRRFIGRRGLCKTIYSDCGTNFIGAERQLRELFALIKSSKHNQTISTTFANEGIEWRFNPPSAPHFGGLWEAGVKSVKRHLYKVIGDQVLTFEELSTVFIQIEALLNSRPLCALSTDPNDLSALTPGHFLIGEPLISLPEPSFANVAVNRLTRWNLLQQIHQSFWRRWHSEYLTSLQSRPKWSNASTTLVEGVLVLIKDEQTAPLHWKLGRITRVFPGKDGISRVAEVKTCSGVLKRPFVKLCPLPYQDTNG